MMKKNNSKKVLDIFKHICTIPRPSGHEEKIGAYLKKFGYERGLEVKTDKVGNVLICKPASEGFEDRPTIILQAHQDMVCEKEASIEHDFMTQPIETYVEEGWLKAKGTTLGADDGLGIAMALAVLDDKELKHGPIECLFTVSEEVGLIGAQNLKSDMMNGTMLINLDSEQQDEIFIGCAGGISTTVTFSYNKETIPDGYFTIRLGVDKLHGGHSGDDIDKGYANANKLIARFLYSVMDKYDIRLCSFNGGNLHNAIPRDANAVIAIPSQHKESIRVDFNIFVSEIEDEFHVTEKEAYFYLGSTEPEKECIENNIARRLILAMEAAFNGVYAMSMDVSGLVETSSNLASIRTNQDNIVLVASQRSSVDSAITAVKNSFGAAFRLAGAKVVNSDGYPGWKPDTDSKLLSLAVGTYKRLFGSAPKVKAIHAGLECGLFLSSYPELDMISIGPTLRGVHSPSERLELSTIDMVFSLLLAILESVPTE